VQRSKALHAAAQEEWRRMLRDINSSQADAMKVLIPAAPAAPALALRQSSVSSARSPMTKSKTRSAAAVHASAIVIDTHADTAQRILDEHFDLADQRSDGDWNLEAARKGNLGAEFFAIWAEPERFKGRYAQRTLDLIDAVKQQVAKHSDQLEFVTSTAGIEQAHHDGKIAALIGIEGGHSIEGSLTLLREYYALGARYMTLTWANSNGWADSSGDIEDTTAAHTKDGLSDFGCEVIREMNRLGMMVDVSHVAERTFHRTLELSQAPVIASHSSARALCDVPRNLDDEMLRAIANGGQPESKGGVGGGVVHVNFYSGFISQEYRTAQRAMITEVDDAVDHAEAQAKAAGRAFTYGQENRLRRSYMDHIPRPRLSALIDHIDHIAKVAGVDHVGLGSDFDGIYGQLPEEIDSPADFPKITAALMERGYSPEDCRKILSGNLLRVFHEVEEVAEKLRAADAKDHGQTARVGN
jgi:membrane dipeptidase